MSMLFGAAIKPRAPDRRDNNSSFEQIAVARDDNKLVKSRAALGGLVVKENNWLIEAVH